MTEKNNSRGASRRRSRQKQKQDGIIWVILGVVLIVVLIGLIFVVNSRKETEEPEGTSRAVSTEAETEETFDDTKLKHDCEINLSSIPGCSGKTIKITKGMDRNDVLEAISKAYEWNVSAINSSANEGNVVKPTVDAQETTAVGNGDSAETEAAEAEDVAALTEIIVTKTLVMEDPFEQAALELIQKIFADDQSSKGDSSLNLYSLEADLESAVEAFAEDADNMWYVEPKGGSIESYDAATDQFLMEGSSDGCRIDRQKLIDDLNSQLSKGNLDCVVPVKTTIISSNDAVQGREYQVIATYVTHTSANPVRNNNVKLACEKLNGTIVRPGEEFSYNYTIGERTAEKGYGAAAAYLNGEVVQEIGGGVCQVSSTLYNAITEAGLKTTYRSPHTFKPTYITPGQDATVSWNGPDYRFANVIANPDISYDTTYAIGIRSVYKDQTVTVSIYGRPVLKSGYALTMESEMTGETEMVRVLIPEGSDKQPTTGDKGSSWKTYLVITKDGTQISREVYHSTKYQGHTEYYLETVETSETSETAESESPVGPGGVIGPGLVFETTAQYGPGSATVPAQESSQASPGDMQETTAADNQTAQTTASTQNDGPIISDEPGGLPGSTTGSDSGNVPGSRAIIEDGP